MVAPGCRMSDANVVVLVPVAGLASQASSGGARVGSALRPVYGVSLVVHAVRRLLAVDSVDDVVVLADTQSDVGDMLDADVNVRVVSGSFADVARERAAHATVLLVHDPLRAFTPPEVVNRVTAAVLEHRRPVVPVLPCSDTVKRLDSSDVVIDTPDRAGLRVAQTPIGYPAELISRGVVVPGSVPAGALTVAGDPRARRLAGAVDVAMLDGGVA
jgi:2-C-methyl-D-erythritol 4-phosphate cytidylyltransferase